MPTLPPRDAAQLPDGVAAEAVVWEETIASGGYASKRLARGTRICLTDLYGDACASMLLFNAEQPSERLNVADTIKVQWNAYLEPGRLLLSDMGRAMCVILEDEALTHDTFCGASNALSNSKRFRAGYSDHPNARDRFLKGVAKHGLSRRDVHPCINLFKGVRIAPNGSILLDHGPFAPGRKILLRAEMDVIVVLANCPHVLDPRDEYLVTPVRVSAWRGEPASEEDPLRNSTPEVLRAYLNTEDYYRR